MNVEESEHVSWVVPVELAQFVRQAAVVFDQDENEVAASVLEIGRDEYVAANGARCPRCACQQPGYAQTCRFCDGQPCRRPGWCDGDGDCQCDLRECLMHGCDHQREAPQK